ncbi:Uncharacterised protein [Mycobacteroides abscessus subsp. abscessus]|nr:Uncharacterised protein [Mycobacteroides abscessus subsp. abscessus]
MGGSGERGVEELGLLPEVRALRVGVVAGVDGDRILAREDRDEVAETEHAAAQLRVRPHSFVDLGDDDERNAHVREGGRRPDSDVVGEPRGPGQRVLGDVLFGDDAGERAGGEPATVGDLLGEGEEAEHGVEVCARLAVGIAQRLGLPAFGHARGLPDRPQRGVRIRIGILPSRPEHPRERVEAGDLRGEFVAAQGQGERGSAVGGGEPGADEAPEAADRHGVEADVDAAGQCQRHRRQRLVVAEPRGDGEQFEQGRGRRVDVERLDDRRRGSARRLQLSGHHPRRRGVAADDGDVGVRAAVRDELGDAPGQVAVLGRRAREHVRFDRRIGRHAQAHTGGVPSIRTRTDAGPVRTRRPRSLPRPGFRTRLGSGARSVTARGRVRAGTRPGHVPEPPPGGDAGAEIVADRGQRRLGAVRVLEHDRREVGRGRRAVEDRCVGTVEAAGDGLGRAEERERGPAQPQLLEQTPARGGEVLHPVGEDDGGHPVGSERPRPARGHLGGFAEDFERRAGEHGRRIDPPVPGHAHDPEVLLEDAG